MQPQRLLLIQDNPFLGTLYRDKLEEVGFSVEIARDGEAGLQRVESMQPHLVLLDAVLPLADVPETIQLIRARPASERTPIVVLPASHHPLAQAAREAGATCVLDGGASSLADVITAAADVLDRDLPSNASGNPGFHLDTRWQFAVLDTAPSSLSAMRQALHTLMHDTDDRAALHTLLHRVHTFSQQMSLLGANALSHIASALEMMMFGLDQFPERLDALALRTLGQAVDFLALLLEREAYAQPVDLSTAHVLVIEDESNARELIVTAMDLVGLRASGFEAPGAGLDMLGTERCDLIFLDVNLPEMNGFEMCTRVRALPNHEHTPIIFLTGMTSFQNRVQSSLSGGNDFVGKPFNIAELGLKALIHVLRGQLGLN
jgi:DNA-binding response OmpR family regulator